MNKQIKKSLMAVAVGAALASAGVTAANAASLLFPYWSTQNGTTSILSLSTGTLTNGSALHYVWNYGPSCTHFDNYGSMTSNDLLQQFVSQPAGTPALFGDKSTPAYFPQLNGGSFGFLVVSDTGSTDPVGKAGTTNPAGSLRGQMIVASAAAGIVTAYNGLEAGSTNEGDFSNLNATAYRLSWYPQSVAGTSWFAVATGNMGTAIGAGSNWTGSASYTNNGQVYGRDEDAYSGSMTGSFTCSASLNPASFMNSAQIASVTNGGLVNVNFTPTNGASGVVLTKLETTTALGGSNTFVTGEKATSGQGW